MNKNTIIWLVAVAILIVGGFLFFNRSRQIPVETVTLAEDETSLLNNVEPIQTDRPNDSVIEFMNQLYYAVPPKSDPIALGSMTSFLSAAAKQTALDQAGNFHPGLFLGIQDVPDLGFEIVGVRYRDNLATAQAGGVAEVTVKMKYSSGVDLEKTFVLSKVGDYWLIDGLVAKS
ncbi:hypothetical protein BK006_01895 [bacterium CG10_49_38]|nr:MAG: hypothetical protein BK006_01895 [bacterium CG10_49_38]